MYDFENGILCLSFSSCLVVVVRLLSRVRLFATPQTVAHRLLCPWNSLGKNAGAGCHSCPRRSSDSWTETHVSFIVVDGFLPLSHQGSPLLCVAQYRNRHWVWLIGWEKRISERDLVLGKDDTVLLPSDQIVSSRHTSLEFILERVPISSEGMDHLWKREGYSCQGWGRDLPWGGEEAACRSLPNMVIMVCALPCLIPAIHPFVQHISANAVTCFMLCQVVRWRASSPSEQDFATLSHSKLVAETGWEIRLDW